MRLRVYRDDSPAKTGRTVCASTPAELAAAVGRGLCDVYDDTAETSRGAVVTAGRDDVVTLELTVWERAGGRPYFEFASVLGVLADDGRGKRELSAEEAAALAWAWVATGRCRHALRAVTELPGPRP